MATVAVNISARGCIILLMHHTNKAALLPPMKLNSFLMTKILLLLENIKTEDFPVYSIRFPVEGFSDEDVNAHFRLMYKDGLIEAKEVKGTFNTPQHYQIEGITLKGYEYLKKNRGVDGIG